MTNNETLYLKARISKTFSYLEYHTDGIIKATRGDDVSTEFSLLKEITIENPSLYDYEKVILSISFDSEIFSFDDMHLEKITSGGTFTVKQGFHLHVDREQLYRIVGEIPCTAILTLKDGMTGETLATLYHGFSILSINSIRLQSAKSILPYLVAKFVVPEHPKVKEIVSLATKYHDGKAFLGYQNKTLNDLVEEVHSLFNAVHDYGISYSNPLSPLDDKEWRVRLPQETISDHRGTCIDTAVLFAALMENIGLHPIVVLIDGHAFVGVFLKEHSFFDYISKSSSVLYNMTAKGIQSALVFETTLADADNSCSFRKTIENAEEKLKGYRGNMFYAIDISTCHKSYFKPLPFANAQGFTDLGITPLTIKDEKLDDVLNQAFIDVERPQEKDRFTTWERKLLDLNKGNKLVAYNFNTALTLSFNTGDYFYEFLKKHDDASFTMRLMSVEIGKGLEVNTLATKEKSETLMANENAVIALGTERQVKGLIRASQEALEETGAPTLYLTLGKLTYTGQDGKKDAPFLLLPIRMVKEKFGLGYTISMDVDDLMINQTFFEYYKVLTGIDYSGFYNINVNDSYNDIISTFKSKQGGDIVLDQNVATISNFTFAHYVMWKDIRSRKEELKKNPIVASLLKNQSIIENQDEDKSADEKDNMSLFAAPLSYDSTQLNAILSCGKGNSFILDGPPGTGKSQTIVNMIVNAMYQGKTVLFVAEKMAALSVVKDRLDELGLGRFALELYSNKANKSSVFAQLQEAMKLGRIKDSEEFKKDCEEIEQEKEKLRAEIQLLHEKKNHRYSLYEALEIHASHEAYLNQLQLSADFADSYDDAKDERVRNILKDISLQAASIKNFNRSVFTNFKMTKFAYFDTDKFLSDTMNLDMELSNLYQNAEKLLKVLKIDESLTRAQYQKLNEILVLYLSDSVRKETLSQSVYFETYNKDKELLGTLCHLKDEDQKLNDYYIDKLIELDVDSLSDLYKNTTGFFAKLKMNKLIKAELSKALKLGRKVDKKQLGTLLATMTSYKKEYISIQKQCQNLNEFFKEDILDNRGKAIEYLTSFENTVKTYRLITELNLMTLDTSSALKLFGSYTMEERNQINLAYQDFGKEYSFYLQHEQKLKEDFGYDYENVGKEDFFRESQEILDYVSDRENADELLSLAKYNADCEVLKKEGLEELERKVSSHEIQVESLTPVFDAALAKAYIELYFRNDSVNSFTSSYIDAALDHYRDLIERYNSIVITSTAYRVSSRFIDNSIDYKDSSPIGSLKKLVAKGGRGITIRNAFKEYEEYIRAYFPCFMMSPLSAAQYLDVSSRKFDVVIFDEASQIPTCEAIGPIARGKALIVSGDPKQMPPTDFFTMDSMQEGSNNVDVSLMDAESLLDDCLSIDMPRIRLSYHYRSKHESLISFSNQNFYDGSLFTFPSTDASGMKISFRYIELKEQKKSTDISQEEIDEILSVIKTIAEDPEKANKTIGVIVFNTRQQEKLKDSLETYLEMHKDLRENLSSRKMPLFIKSLENVQGDERDIILLSVGFRKTNGNTALIQGPITLDKGERRLNVAITRAKEEMIVISTIRSHEIQAENSLHRGPKFLKEFLRFAEGNSTTDLKTSSAINEDAILHKIQSLLKERGYECDLNVGTSEFRVPLAVKNKEEDKYVLALFLDNEPLSYKVSQRDKHYVQKNMLCSLGWKTMDVYVLDLFRYQKRTIDRIIEAIGKEEEETKTEKLEPVFVSDNTRFDYQIANYVEYKPLNQLSNPSALEVGVFYRPMQKALAECIAVEQPVSYDTIRNRMKIFFNVSKYSAKSEGALKFNLEHGGFVTTKEGDKIFYWNGDNYDHVVQAFRSSDREIENIAKEEILVLMKRVLEAQKEMNRDDFLRAVATLMNIRAVTANVKAKLDAAIDYGIGSGILNPENIH